MTRWLPRSIAGRMLALSAAATLAALAVAGVIISGVLQRVVTEGVDRRLDGQIALMASTVDAAGRIDAARLATASRALSSERGWRWQIVAPGQTLGSRNFPRLDAGPPRPPGPPGPPGAEADRDEAMPREGRDGQHHRIHARELVLATSGGPVRLMASAPRRVVEQPILDAALPLLGLLAILSLLLAVAAAVQIRLGLRPLRALRDDVARVRGGQAARVTAEQPHELAPLAEELNALLGENDAALTAARASAANLAHALKTPVATLALELRDDPAASRQVARIDAVIRHHLSQSRDRVAGIRRSTAIAPALADLKAMIARLAEGRVAIDLTLTDDLVVAMDPADFDELAGNLIDNAARHAISRVAISAERHDGAIVLAVEDDGPGIPLAARERSMQPGVRLDERGEGHGFGLAIARELTALYGGQFTLGDSAIGGLRVDVTLPARALPPAA